jgi:hypothetical protein
MSDNPLKQYFRRPALYFKIPSEAKYYPPGLIDIPPNGEIAVYPMTSVDEMTIRTPDGLFNGQAVVDVIKNCIPAIKDPWLLNDIDLEACIIAIRAASVDGKIEIETVCPACDETTKYDVDLLRLLSEKKNVDFSTPLELGELSIKFRPLTYAENNTNSAKQFEVQRLVAMVDDIEDAELRQKTINDGVKRLNEMLIDAVTQMIEYITTPESTVSEKQYIREFLVECDSKTSAAIKKASVEMRTKNDTPPLSMKCVSCQHDYKQPLVLNFTNFFG